MSYHPEQMQRHPQPSYLKTGELSDRRMPFGLILERRAAGDIPTRKVAFFSPPRITGIRGSLGGAKRWRCRVLYHVYGFYNISNGDKLHFIE